MFGVRCPTAPLATKLFDAIKQSEKLKVTARRMNMDLDTTPYEHKAVTRYEFVLATSETQFETRADGVLPRSVMIIGKGTYDFKDWQAAIKKQFSGRAKGKVVVRGPVAEAAKAEDVDAKVE